MWADQWRPLRRLPTPSLKGNIQEKEIATHSSPLSGKTPWTEESGGRQSLGLQATERLRSLTQPSPAPGFPSAGVQPGQRTPGGLAWGSKLVAGGGKWPEAQGEKGPLPRPSRRPLLSHSAGSTWRNPSGASTTWNTELKTQMSGAWPPRPQCLRAERWWWWRASCDGPPAPGPPLVALAALLQPPHPSRGLAFPCHSTGVCLPGVGGGEEAPECL